MKIETCSIRSDDGTQCDLTTVLSGCKRPSNTLLRKEFVTALTSSLTNEKTMWGLDPYSKNPQSRRTVLQFSVSDEFFDWFFNDPEGYRGRYRRSPLTGLTANRELVADANQVLQTFLPTYVDARIIAPGFKDGGPSTLKRETIISSINQNWAKAWVSGVRIADWTYHPFRSNELCLRSAQSGTTCKRFTCAEGDGWISITGGFVFNGDCFQVKCPMHRAIGINKDGDA